MKNLYSKKAGNRELNSKRKRTKSNVKKISKDNVLLTDPSYQKKDGKLSPSLFIIVSGGEKREKNYFDYFKNNSKKFPRIKIKFFCKNENGETGLDVNKLVKEAIRIKKEKDETKADDIMDSINLVTDLDHFYPQLIENIPICEKENLNLYISNPCFEIWLYYSYFQEKPSDFNIPESKTKISKHFKTFLGNKKEGGIDPRKAPMEISNAIKNSEKNYKECNYKIPKLFSTKLHILAKELYKLMD